MALKKGSLLLERYKIIDILGKGGMGAVYRAEDSNLGIVVAVKENLFTTEEYARQFRREANILASLRHPNLPRVFDHFEIKDHGQYLVMDYIVGEDLRQRMDRVGSIDEEEVIISGAAICDALQYLHTRKPVILHRDIKPGNIKIDPEGQSYLVDFGLAKIVQGSEATTTGARAMTPGYSSPEQYGTARTDPRSDVYSLGATLYAALSGNIPEDGLARAMDQIDLTPLRQQNVKISRKISAVIEKALAIHPEDRYQSAEEFKIALLTSRLSTRNIKRGEDLTIVPPSEDIMAAIELGDVMKSAAALKTKIEMSDESASRIKKKSRARTWQNVLNFLILIVSGLLLWFSAGLPGLSEIVFFDTFQNNESEELVDPMASEAVNVPVDLPTETEVVFMGDATQIFTETATILPTDTPTSIPTETEIPPTNTGTPTPNLPTVTVAPTEIIATEIVGFVSTQDPNLPNVNEIIVYASSRFGDVQLWQYDYHSKTSVQVFHMDGGACQPDFSPDGKKIIFISPCKENRDFYLGTTIYTYDISTKLIENMNLGDNVFDPAWSPDGKKLLYTKAIDSTKMQVLRYDFDTGVVVAMTDADKLNFQPDWSLDGNQIAFSSSRNGGFHLYVMPNLPAGEIKILSRGGGFDLDPAWFGQDFILFSKKEADGTFYIATRVNIEMLGILPVNYQDFSIDLNSEILPGVGVDVNEAMSWITFESWPDGTHHNLYISRPDGTGKIQLTDDEHYDFDPVWGPNN